MQQKLIEYWASMAKSTLLLRGEKAKLEAERERLVHLKELEAQKEQAEELRCLAIQSERLDNDGQREKW